jgi:hypothetical protein
MAHSILTAIVTLGLLASGDACVWLCQAAASSGDVQVTESHCASRAKRAEPKTRTIAISGAELPGPALPAPALPAHDDCPGCAWDSVTMPSPLEGSTARFSLAFALVGAPLVHERLLGVVRPGHDSSHANRYPPRDILSITSSLRL